jgi:hypothetical protein
VVRFSLLQLFLMMLIGSLFKIGTAEAMNLSTKKSNRCSKLFESGLKLCCQDCFSLSKKIGYNACKNCCDCCMIPCLKVSWECIDRAFANVPKLPRWLQYSNDSEFKRLYYSIVCGLITTAGVSRTCIAIMNYYEQNHQE